MPAKFTTPSTEGYRKYYPHQSHLLLPYLNSIPAVRSRAQKTNSDHTFFHMYYNSLYNSLAKYYAVTFFLCEKFLKEQKGNLPDNHQLLNYIKFRQGYNSARVVPCPLKLELKEWWA